MNKETAVAILVGFGVGLTAALLILFLPGKLQQLNLTLPFGGETQEETHLRPDNADGKGGTGKENGAAADVELSIDSPEENALIESETAETTISGKAPAGSRVVLLSLSDKKATKADGSGNFKSEVKLTEGENKIQVAAYKDQQEPQVKILTVYYSEP